MSDAPRAGAGPAPVTDEEVAALAAGRRPRELVRRITGHRPAAATGRLSSEKAAPPAISGDEMVRLRRSGRPSAAVRGRLEAAAAARTDARSSRRRRKDTPTAEPPAGTAG